MTKGLYIYSKTLYHKADARGKILFSILYSLAVLLTSSIPYAYSLLAVTVCLSLYAVGWRETLEDFRRVMLIVICIFLCMPLQSRSGDPLITIGSFKLVTTEGFHKALLINAKFLTISYVFSLLLETTRLEVIILALRAFRLPYSAALTLTLSLSLIPTLSDAYLEIKDSMSLRINEERKRESLLAVVVAVIVRSIKTIPETASTLEERGYGRNIKRTSYRKLENSPRRYTEIAFSIIIPLALIIIPRIF